VNTTMGDERPSETGRRGREPAPLHGRVIVADDDVLLREGLARLLTRTGFHVVDQAGDGKRLVELVDRNLPDIVIVDTRMPPTCTTEGLQAAREIREKHPSVGILVLSAYIEVDHAMELMSNGERIGYLLKSGVTDVSEFVDTLERIYRGGSAVDPSLVAELVAIGHRGDPLAELSVSEHDVLRLMAEGRTDADIAERLEIEHSVVERDVRGVQTKLCLPETDAAHRRALATLAYLDAR
jgi:DNA-binding NarL/FixJ family response regulator